MKIRSHADFQYENLTKWQLYIWPRAGPEVIGAPSEIIIWALNRHMYFCSTAKILIMFFSNLEAKLLIYNLDY